MVVGVVLCGGRSSRMGEDKGLLRIREKVCVSHAKEKLLSVCDRVYISINGIQEREYSKYFGKEELLLDAESYKGPQAGILSVHKSLEDMEGDIKEGRKEGRKEGGYEWLYVLACDMVNVPKVLIERLYKRCIRYGDNYDVYVYRCANNVEGLCGIYSRDYLSGTKEASIGSVQELLGGARCNIEELGEEGCKLLYSINSKRAYDILRGL